VFLSYAIAPTVNSEPINIPFIINFILSP